MRAVVFIVLSIMLVLASLGFGIYAYISARQYFARDVVYVAPMLGQEHLHFSNADIETFSHDNPNFTFSAESRGNVYISTHLQSVTTPVIFTDTMYFEMHRLEFIQGSHWQDRLLVNSIIVNSALAWRLFGTSYDVVGKAVWVNEVPHFVVGVVCQAHGNVYQAWMPATDTRLSISALYARPYRYSPLAVSSVRGIISASGLAQSVEEYAIVRIDRYIESIGIRYRLLLLFIWIFVLFLLSNIGWQCARSLPSLIKNGLLADIAKNMALPVVWVLVCIFLFIGANDILQWLPNLSDPYTSIFNCIYGVGLLPPEVYLPYGLVQLSNLSRYANIAFISGMVGILNLLFCLRLNVLQN